MAMLGELVGFGLVAFVVLVVPAPVAGLPMGQARAYWLCDHEKGPKLDQYRAAELLDTTQGSVSNHLRRAREKIDRG
jgi:predicted DNA-binding protein (UPF0251 family)